jgi:hypothetical protein
MLAGEEHLLIVPIEKTMAAIQIRSSIYSEPDAEAVAAATTKDG